jgi:hypothetical protein
MAWCLANGAARIGAFVDALEMAFNRIVSGLVIVLDHIA